MIDNPFFSVIIPTLNEEQNLPILLNSLASQTDRNFEVIVSDSDSKDKTREIAESYQKKLPALSVLDHESKNVSEARNFGAIKAAGKFLIFFDADGEIENNFFKDLKQKIEKYNLDATTVWNRDKKKDLTGNVILFFLNLSMSIFQWAKPVANGPCMVLKKEIFEKLKGFDETIIFGEDFDLMRRFHKIKNTRFKVFQTPIFYVSTRRFEKEGFFLSAYKSVKALMYQLFFGPIRKPLFKYEMGGQEFKKVENVNLKMKNDQPSL